MSIVKNTDRAANRPFVSILINALREGLFASAGTGGEQAAIRDRVEREPVSVPLPALPPRRPLKFVAPERDIQVSGIRTGDPPLVRASPGAGGRLAQYRVDQVLISIAAPSV